MKTKKILAGKFVAENGGNLKKSQFLLLFSYSMKLKSFNINIIQPFNTFYILM
jgi:hypothetical protein